MDSGLLEKKIKLSSDPDRIAGFVRDFLSRIAYQIRRGEDIEELIKSTHIESMSVTYFARAEDIAEAYFSELRILG